MNAKITNIDHFEENRKQELQQQYDEFMRDITELMNKHGVKDVVFGACLPVKPELSQNPPNADTMLAICCLGDSLVRYLHLTNELTEKMRKRAAMMVEREAKEQGANLESQEEQTTPLGLRRMLSIMFGKGGDA